jgi:putative PEP-CTERM system response regulator
MQTVLAIDPDADFLQWVSKHLTASDVRVIGATNADQGFAVFQQEKPDIVLSELQLQPVTGMELLRRIRQTDPNALVILNTGFPPTNAVIEAMKHGAYEFLRKEALSYELRPVVEDALKTRESMRTTAVVVPLLDNLQQSIIGQSPAMQGVFKLIGRASRSTAPVLITGESGCGKEVVARAIHRFSARQHKEFVAINCAAIPENLLESELFGHEKGSFTGAVALRVGRFEQCDGGTLFLDEIGELPLPIQVKLLRFLQERTFQRVGGRQEIQSDVRIVAATNADLKETIKSGGFREDLYFRLAVVVLNLPPLRDRGEDVQVVARDFLKRYAAQNGRGELSFGPDAVRALSRYQWPGNVRELQNRVQRAVIMADGGRLSAADLELAELTGEDRPTMSLKEAREQVERTLIEQSLRRHRGRISAAAQDLGVSRPTLYELMQKLGIQRE